MWCPCRICGEPQTKSKKKWSHLSSTNSPKILVLFKQNKSNEGHVAPPADRW